jgi:type III secretion system YscQ/HrcQ family protein
MSLDTDGPGNYERTMVVDTRHLKRPAKPWKPFRFSKLEKVSINDSRLTGRLQWLTPKVEAIEALRARLKGLFDTPVAFGLRGLQVLGSSELRRHLTEPTFLSFVAAGPHRGRAVLEVELALAHLAVDTLLGGAGETVGLRPLTEIEEGVMSFVMLEALKALGQGMESEQVRLRLEGVASEVDEATARLGEDGPVLVLQLEARIGQQAGMVRLFVPAGLLEALEPADISTQRRAALALSIQSHLGRLSSVRSWLRAEIGYAEISRGDLASLRVKDVVLVDAFSARPDRGEDGTARLRVGMGRVGCLNAEVFIEDGQYQARITELLLGEQTFLRRTPSESDEAAAEALGEDGEPEEFTNPELHKILERSVVNDRMDAGDLLGDIPLQISVELARVPVTADQVVSMRVGQVIELSRAPGEPVDLSVNGKLIGRGELVEVEGHLGVRVLSLVG